MTDAGICRFLYTEMNLQKNRKNDILLLNTSRGVLMEIDCGAITAKGSKNIGDTGVEAIVVRKINHICSFVRGINSPLSFSSIYSFH